MGHPAPQQIHHPHLLIVQPQLAPSLCMLLHLCENLNGVVDKLVGIVDILRVNLISGAALGIIILNGIIMTHHSVELNPYENFGHHSGHTTIRRLLKPVYQLLVVDGKLLP